MARLNIYNDFGFSNLTPEEYKKRTSAVNASLFTIFAGLIHSLIYAFLGFPYVTLVVLGYAIFSVTSLFYLRYSHNFGRFSSIQLVLISIFPFATQVFIGGFINASGVGFAAFIAPATALLYTKASTARRYLLLFAVLMVSVALLEYYYLTPSVILPRPVIITFFAINFIATLSIIYFLMESFLIKQEELRVELRQSIASLKNTQTSLIHAEKMASLGELTAGIAHEIQNPLNFVNNFSELNLELHEEVEEERTKYQALRQISGAELSEEEKLVTEILKDIKENESKINHHGKRADAIVKGMLAHSRSSSGEKVLTDINALVAEFLRLSYHGLRAKDKSFQAEYKTDFDPNLPKVNVIPQDVGRVLLNIINNAFQAVGSRHGLYPQPTVTVTTKNLGDNIQISVQDNGPGIPDAIKDKIFQPFFTTKPAGSGTGLGLSLSYDIIKSHGGDLRVKSIEGEGTEMIIFLPIEN